MSIFRVSSPLPAETQSPPIENFLATVLQSKSTLINRLNEACATRLCSHTFSVEFILEPREGWLVTSSMLTPPQTNRPKRALTTMCVEVTYKCRLLGLSLLALADVAHT